MQNNSPGAHFKKTFGFLIIIFFYGGASFLSSGCSRKEENYPDQNLTVALRDDLLSVDPGQAEDLNSIEVLGQIYEALYQYDFGSTDFKIIPLLADGDPVYSEDKKSLRVGLRKDVRFSNSTCFKASDGKGRVVNAADFIFAIRRLALPSLHSPAAPFLRRTLEGFSALEERLTKAPPEQIKSILIATDTSFGVESSRDFELTFKFKSPQPQFVHHLTRLHFAPVPVEAVDAFGDSNWALQDLPVGTGPFKLSKWEKSISITLDQNENFRPEFFPTQISAEFKIRGFEDSFGKRLPLLKKINFKIIKSEKERWEAFKTGLLDISPIPQELRDDSLQDWVKKKFTIEWAGFTTLHYLHINPKDPQLSSSSVRNGIFKSIDRKLWNDVFFNGQAKLQDSFIPPHFNEPGILSWTESPQRAEANMLLKNGPKTLRLDLRGNSPMDHKLGQFFTQQLKSVGVELKIFPQTFFSFLNKRKTGQTQLEYGMVVLDVPTKDGLLSALSLPEAPSETLPIIPGLWISERFIADPKVKNYRANPFYLPRYKYVRKTLRSL